MTDPVAAGKPRTSREGAPSPHLPWSRAAVVSVLRVVFLVAGLVTGYYLLPLDWHSGDFTALVLAFGLLAVGLFFGWEVWLIVHHSPSPRLKAVEALAATVALYLVLYASVYYVVDRAVPGSFSEHLRKTDALYFTLSTFTTVGFGDITAVSETGRVVVMCQMTCGLLLVGVAARVLTVAVAVGLRRQRRRTPE